MPKTGKSPPTNESTMIVPPTFCEWKSTQEQEQQQQPFSIFENHPFTPTVVVPHGNVVVLPISHLDELLGVTFKTGWDDEEDVSVMGDGNLTLNSALVYVISDVGVIAELGGGVVDTYKYLIQKRSGVVFTLWWDEFNMLTVKIFIQIKNVDKDCVITLKMIKV